MKIDYYLCNLNIKLLEIGVTAAQRKEKYSMISALW
jgi:hypothetical protein